MSRPVRPTCRSAAQRPACPLFLFPTCAVRDKARLFSQRLIVPLARWCAWTALISPALSSPGKDFLLVLPFPVWTGSVGWRWGATEDRSGREYFTFFGADSTFFAATTWGQAEPVDVFVPAVSRVLCVLICWFKKSCIFLFPMLLLLLIIWPFLNFSMTRPPVQRLSACTSVTIHPSSSSSFTWKCVCGDSPLVWCNPKFYVWPEMTNITFLK